MVAVHLSLYYFISGNTHSTVLKMSRGGKLPLSAPFSVQQKQQNDCQSRARAYCWRFYYRKTKILNIMVDVMYTYGYQMDILLSFKLEPSCLSKTSDWVKINLSRRAQNLPKSFWICLPMIYTNLLTYFL